MHHINIEKESVNNGLNMINIEDRTTTNIDTLFDKLKFSIGDVLIVKFSVKKISKNCDVFFFNWMCTRSTFYFLLIGSINIMVSSPTVVFTYVEDF